jgi:hypothetical protein
MVNSVAMTMAKEITVCSADHILKPLFGMGSNVSSSPEEFSGLIGAELRFVFCLGCLCCSSKLVIMSHDTKIHPKLT